MLKQWRLKRERRSKSVLIHQGIEGEGRITREDKITNRWGERGKPTLAARKKLAVRDREADHLVRHPTNRQHTKDMLMYRIDDTRHQRRR